MVHLGLNQSNEAVLEVAASLSEQCHARLIGIAACQPEQFPLSDGYSGFEVLAACRDELEKELSDAEGQFRRAMKDDEASLQWRSRYTTSSLSSYIAEEARCADLLITGIEEGEWLDSARHVSIGDLVMRTGRPVLIVPQEAPVAPFNRVVLAWKDTREARRAVVDALPLLTLAKKVTIVEIADENERTDVVERLDEVAAWLALHGVTADVRAVPSYRDDASCLEAILSELEADLVIAGAFGHSRMREWVFGGVTRGLLHGKRCALLSH
jgi:nucleotide-binding universal stress UspA family protein